MADRFIELAKKPLMRGGEHDQVAAGRDMPGDARQFPAVILDMLQHINIEDRVERCRCRKRGDVANLDAETFPVRQRRNLRRQKLGEIGIGLQTEPIG